MKVPEARTFPLWQLFARHSAQKQAENTDTAMSEKYLEQTQNNSYIGQSMFAQIILKTSRTNY